MHGREGEERKRRRHMWPVPAPGTAASASSSSSAPPPSLAFPENPSSESDSSRSSCDSFLKDGRKIRVGDCALFQAGNAPPFIGIIRWFTEGKEDHLRLCVNWLYRPADIKLAKGVLLEAAPNEVFYSFHKDVITAASLLHPCKVVFLRKGVELPAGVSSFICRRVYDITNKCLWWLTDQDYINERQEEVDQLLDRTQLEMHAAVQSGGRSPKPLNGPSSTQQLKSSSESDHNTGPSLPFQSKLKKRDRSDQGTEHIKRERSSKPDDGDSCKSDNMMKAELVKITEKGGLISTEGVEKLVNLLQHDRPENKIDVSGRILVANVIAATDRYDCLGRFVQLKGVPVLNDWLQQVYKSKAGDGTSHKESDKAVEELLLALLCALAKLPVNLNALQACNIGKSVNHLRSHKNPEIQKKARSLIDTWKKRVNAEITKINDAKSVGLGQPVWQVKSGSSDVSHVGNRRSGPTDVVSKSPVTHTACKSSKPGHSDPIVKSPSATQGSSKATSIATGSKDSLCKAAHHSGGTEMTPTAVKEEKSSSSSHSQNNSQSCSSDHAKTVGSSWKEDTRSSSAGSINATKAAGASSRHRRSSNGVTVTSISGVQKETHPSKSGSLNRAATLEKSSQSGLTCEKPIDMPAVDHGNNHRLIVRLPNPARSPARSASGGSFDDPSISGSRASSPGFSDKHEHSDRRVKPRVDAYQSNIVMDANTESWLSNDVKELPVGAGGVRSPAADEEHIRSAGETGKDTEAPGAACSSSGNEKGVSSTETRTRSSLSSIIALIESCVKYSEASDPSAVEDDVGMNLLASVATGEISKSDLISPTGSAGASPGAEDPSTEAKSRLSSADDLAQSHIELDEAADADSIKKGKSVNSISTGDVPCQDGTNFLGNSGNDVSLQDNKLTGEEAEQSASGLSSHKTKDSCPIPKPKLEEERDGNFLVSKSAGLGKWDNDGVRPLEEKHITGLDNSTDCKLKERSSMEDESKPRECARQKIGDDSICTFEVANKDGCDHDIAAPGIKIEKLVIEECQSGLTAKVVPEVAPQSCQQQPQMPVIVERSDNDAISSGVPDVAYPENADGSKTSKPDNVGVNHFESNDKHECDSLNLSKLDESVRLATTSCSTACAAEDLKIKESLESLTVGSASQEPPSSCTAQEMENQSKPAGSRFSGAFADVKEDLASSLEASSLAVKAVPDVASKLDFDLNEGITGDDGTQVETSVSISTVCSSIGHLPSLSLFSNSMLTGLPAPITVAAPAKGPFVPPENLLKSKDEPGWKGSAATSAFRPAEPRKVLEVPLNTSGVLLPSDSAGKQCRPPLDIDLNEPDERALEDMATQSSAKAMGSELGTVGNLDAPGRISGGLDLDLNRVDEGMESGQFLVSTSHRMEVPLFAIGQASTEFPNREANMLRDFDLNNGPGLDEVCAEPVTRNQNTRSTGSVPFLPAVAGVRMNPPELGSVSSWFPPGGSYPAVAIPSFLTNRGEHPYPIVAAAGGQRILGPVTASGPYGGDVYRGPGLSASPAMAFAPATAFPYAGFTFGSNFPLASTSFSGGSATFVDSSSGAGSGFPAIPSPLVGPAGGILSNYPRPYAIGPPEGSASGGSDNSRKWITSALDLNAGPGNAEGKDDRLPLPSRQLVSNSQAFMEEQVRMYAVAGGGLKRKEPEGGWDADRSAYKQISWQ
ncbi:unnamed protein product [Musa acuminata subsp. malaccensis]|uniref:(wild Malaysian banana) hypothetical protein n=1 Tax=Musa acuminata subsp. malaccensis TaxID=214687 RepID=A0A804IAG2_MUSAM|nr:PREDICTED: uncharacterized protein LOC103977832 [Musa acuminata subsp. malaccensis]CAG1849715.1 unnamed protein product [Musa acuminata subsp. malaccensis]